MPSKTAELDETIPIELAHYRFVGDALAKHLRLKKRNRDELLFTIQPQEVISFLKEAAGELELCGLGALHPYRLRHGGASSDYAAKRRPLQEIQRIGRWRSFKSLRRYEKGGRINQMLQSLPAAVLAAARAAEGLLRQALL